MNILVIIVLTFLAYGGAGLVLWPIMLLMDRIGIDDHVVLDNTKEALWLGPFLILFIAANTIVWLFKWYNKFIKLISRY